MVVALPSELVSLICLYILNLCDEFVVQVSLNADGTHTSTYQPLLSELHEELLMTHAALYTHLSDRASRKMPVVDIKGFYRCIRRIIYEVLPHNPFSLEPAPLVQRDSDSVLECAPELMAGIRAWSNHWFGFQPLVLSTAGVAWAVPEAFTYCYSADCNGVAHKTFSKKWVVSWRSFTPG